MQPKSTDCNEVQKLNTGLTPQQEQAAALLTSGLPIQKVADQLEVHRSTLWHWRQLETFQAYLNVLKKSHRLHAEEGILSLQEEAIATVHRVMIEGSDNSTLRAATFVLSAIDNIEVGSTDV